MMFNDAFAQIFSPLAAAMSETVGFEMSEESGRSFKDVDETESPADWRG